MSLFTGGCVAADYVAVPCPSRVADGFAEAWGSEPWDAVRDRDVSVVLRTVAAGETRPAVACTGSGAVFPYACPDPAWITATLARAVTPGAATRVVGYQHSIGGLDVSVELLADDDGAVHGRVCTVPYSDGPSQDGCAPSGRGRGACAVSGTLTITAMPTTRDEIDAAALDVSATFEDGSTIALRL